MGVLKENMVIDGQLQVLGAVYVPASSFGNTEIEHDASAPVAAEKLEQQVLSKLTQTGTAASVTQPLHIAEGDGEIVAVRAASIAIAVGAATVTVDVKKNGTTILSSVITLDSSNVARVFENGTLAVTTFSDGDFFEVVTVATASGGTIPTGLIVQLVTREKLTA